MIAAIGAAGVAAPQRLLGVVRRLQNAAGLYSIAAVRVLYGVSLYLVGPDSSSPQIVRGLGVFVTIAGLITPLIGVRRFGVLLDWWASKGFGFIRGWSALACTFGLFLVVLVAR